MNIYKININITMAVLLSFISYCHATGTVVFQETGGTISSWTGNGSVYMENFMGAGYGFMFPAALMSNVGEPATMVYHAEHTINLAGYDWAAISAQYNMYNLYSSGNGGPGEFYLRYYNGSWQNACTVSVPLNTPDTNTGNCSIPTNSSQIDIYCPTGYWALDYANITVIGDHRPALSGTSLSPGAYNTGNFTYGVVYTDADNDAPSYIRVHVLLGGSEISGSPFAMTYQGGSYTSGATYSCSVNLGTQSSGYTYYFDTSDGILTNNTSTYNGPTVFNPSISGYVKDPANNAMVGIGISLSGTSSASTTTDSNGYYAFTGITYGGYYTVTITNHGPYGVWTYNPGNTITCNNVTSSLTNQNFTRINRAPSAALSWSGESGYTTGGVEPKSGGTSSPYVYHIMYSDPDNDPPATGYPKVQILNNGIPISGSPFSMSQTVPTNTYYISGATYTFTDSLPAGLLYSYYFIAYDQYNANSTAPATASGPAVSPSPFILWTGEAGYTTGAVEPGVSAVGATTSFRLQYQDPNNNAPNTGYPRVHIFNAGVEIAGSPYTMGYVSGNYNTGAIYKYDIVLSTVSMAYSYSMEAQNLFSAPSNVLVGTGPVVCAAASGIVRFPDGSPMPGVTLSLSGFNSSTCVSGSNGSYSFLVTTNSYTLATSPVSYYSFFPAQISFNDMTSDATNYDFIRLNSSPTFSSSVVNYQTALTTQTFTFSVVYKDAENDAPAPGSLKVDILSNGSVIKTLPLSYTGNSYINGVTCCSPGITFNTVGHYTYYFEGADSWGYTAYYTGDPGNLYFDVTDVSVYNFKNTSPQAQDGCNVISSKVLLSWSAVDALGAPITYSFLFGQESAGDSSIALRSRLRGGEKKAPQDVNMSCLYTGANSSYSFEDLSSGQIYYWQVQAADTRGSVSSGPVWSFNTINLPNSKVLNYPNPFSAGRQYTNIVFYASGSGTADFYVFSEFGRNMFHASIPFTAGSNSYAYNGRDDNGNVLMNGSYPYIVNVEGRRLKNVLLVVK